MARAVWKGPFVEESLMKKVDKYKTDPKKIPIRMPTVAAAGRPRASGCFLGVYGLLPARLLCSDDVR